MSTHNIGFYEDLLTKIIFQLSSNKHLISSADNTRYVAIKKPIKNTNAVNKYEPKPLESENSIAKRKCCY